MDSRFHGNDTFGYKAVVKGANEGAVIGWRLIFTNIRSPIGALPQDTTERKSKKAAPS